MDPAPSPAPPDQIAEIVRVTAQLHADHHRTATSLQRALEHAVGLLGRPGFSAGLAIAAACWIGGNLAAPVFGYPAVEPPPFQGLELVASLAALCLTVLILTTQRRADQLAQQREQMTLELAVLSEQKLAKIIALLEESRRDNPLLHDRTDPSADAMAVPADPLSLRDTTSE